MDKSLIRQIVMGEITLVVAAMRLNARFSSTPSPPPAASNAAVPPFSSATSSVPSPSADLFHLDSSGTQEPQLMRDFRVLRLNIIKKEMGHQQSSAQPASSQVPDSAKQDITASTKEGSLTEQNDDDEDIISYLRPFLNVIHSEEISGPITGVALSSVEKFLRLNLITPRYICKNATTTTSVQRIVQCMELITDTVTHCRFEATDPDGDEVVLFKILSLLEVCLASEYGNLMGDDVILEMIKTCFRLCIQLRLSELLRRTAEHTLMRMVQIVFQHDDNLAEVESEGDPFSQESGNPKTQKNASSSSLSSSVPSIQSSQYGENQSSSNLSQFPAKSAPILISVSSSAPSSIINNYVHPDKDYITARGIRFQRNENDGIEIRDSVNDTHSLHPASLKTTGSFVGCYRRHFKTSAQAKVISFLCTLAEFPATASTSSASSVSSSINAVGGLVDGEGIRLLGLSLILTVLQTSPIRIHRWPILSTVVKDDVCRCLMMNLNCAPTNDLTTHTVILRIIVCLYTLYRRLVMGQLEIALNILITHLSSSNLTYPVIETTLDHFVELIKIPSFAVDIYANLDCNISGTDLLERISRFLYKNSLPSGQGQGHLWSVNLLALECMIGIVDGIVDRCNKNVPAKKMSVDEEDEGFVRGKKHESNDWNNVEYVREESRRNKKIKKLFIECGIAFNNRLAEGLKMAREKGLIGQQATVEGTTTPLPPTMTTPPPQTGTTSSSSTSTLVNIGSTYLSGEDLCNSDGIAASAAAVFLRRCPNISQEKVGEFIGKLDPYNICVLKFFTKSFSVRGISLSSALREYLSTFRLPKEAQMIARILEMFSHHYYHSNTAQSPEGLDPGNNHDSNHSDNGSTTSVQTSRNYSSFAGADAVYVLTYSIVLLNTDQHNIMVRDKMSQDQYVRNARGINNGKDLPVDLLVEIYNDIKNREIKVRDEEADGEVTLDRWPALIQRFQALGEYVEITLNKNILNSGLCYLAPQAIMQAYDPDIFAMFSKNLVVALSAAFESSNNYHITSRVLNALSKCALVASYYQMDDIFDTIVISLCKFTRLGGPAGGYGHAYERQCRITLGSDTKALQALTHVFNLTRSYGDNLREGWSNVINIIVRLHEWKLLPDLLSDMETLGETETRKRQDSLAGEQKRVGHSASSGWFGSWFGPSSDPEPFLSGHEDAEENAKSAVLALSVRSVIDQSKSLGADSFYRLIRALVFKSLIPSPSNSSSNVNADLEQKNAVFCLELLTDVTLTNEHRIIFVWVLVYDHFASIIQNATRPSLLVEKAVICLLLLCVKLIHREDISVKILRSLEVFLSLEASVADAMSATIAVGVTKLLETAQSSIKTPAGWKTIFALLEKCAYHSNAREKACNALFSLINNTSARPPISITPETFLPCFNALYAFAKTDISTSSYHAGSGNNINSNSCENEIPAYVSSSTNIALEAMKGMYTMFELVSTVNTLKVANSSVDDHNSYAPIHRSPVWAEYWSPVLMGFTCLCRDLRAEVRNHAMTYIQRALLSPDLQIMSPQGLRICFEQVVLTLCGDLLKPFPPAATPSNPTGSTSGQSVSATPARSQLSRSPINQNQLVQQQIAIEETRVRAIALLSKIFLQYLPALTQLSDFHSKLWVSVLKYIEMFMAADHSGYLAEAIPEQLKNVILVMLEYGGFQCDTPVGGKDIWVFTWEKIDSFCPELKLDDSFKEQLKSFGRVPLTLQGRVEVAPVANSSPVLEAHTAQSVSVPVVQSVPVPVVQSVPLVSSPINISSNSNSRPTTPTTII